MKIQFVATTSNAKGGIILYIAKDVDNKISLWIDSTIYTLQVNGNGENYRHNRTTALFPLYANLGTIHVNVEMDGINIGHVEMSNPVGMLFEISEQQNIRFHSLDENIQLIPAREGNDVK